MEDVVIVAAVRTPVGKFLGSLPIFPRLSGRDGGA